MKHIVNLLWLFLFSVAKSQSGYWQQYLSYTIDVQLNVPSKMLTANETLVYHNHSPDTLSFIWFHLYPNAYKDNSTALYQQIKNDHSKYEDRSHDVHGYISDLSFTVNGEKAATEAHPNKQYIDITKLILPHPLLPGDSVIITTPFKVKLPNYFSRSGFADDEFIVCQWYPKPAVYDKNGWHEMPYLDRGEFYSEYASYHVNITVPSNIVIAATGVLQNKTELSAYKALGDYNRTNRSQPPHLYQPVSGGNKTLSYVIDSVPDFAFFADPGFVIEHDTLQLPSARVKDVFTYYHNGRHTNWVNSTDYVKDATARYSRWIGEYQYPVVQAVEGPKNNSSGGMEYPTITLITAPDAKPEALDEIVAHEVGHNWFMSMLGTNERDHAWMDEGLNSYYEFRYAAEKYRTNIMFAPLISAAMKKLSLHDFQLQVYNAITTLPISSAIETKSADFTDERDYSLTVYIKTAEWMYLLESTIGADQVDSCFQHYFNLWKNKHPQPGDMKAAFEEVVHGSLASFFSLLNKAGTL